MSLDSTMPIPLKIFLVENHEDTLTYLASYLKESGHEVQSAKSMGSALEQLASAPVEVLISDIGLPDGDGWQLMRRVGELRKPAPFGIAMSGYSMRSDVEKSLSAGYKHHLIKPFLPEELDVLLEQAASSLGKN